MDKLRSEIQNISREYFENIRDVDDAYSYFQENNLCLYKMHVFIPENTYSNKESKTLLVQSCSLFLALLHKSINQHRLSKFHTSPELI